MLGDQDWADLWNEALDFTRNGAQRQQVARTRDAVTSTCLARWELDLSQDDEAYVDFFLDEVTR